MRVHHRSYVTLAVLATLTALPAAAALADEPAPSASPASAATAPCRVVDGSLVTPLSSKDARGGEIFHFTATPSDGAPAVDGVGVVDFVRGAGRGGRPGQIAVELRFLQLPGGTHVPAMIAPEKDGPAVYNGRTRNAPFVLSALGFAKGTGFHIATGVIGVYNFLHSGSQAVVPAGTHLRIVLGDDYLTGGCTVS